MMLIHLSASHWCSLCDSVSSNHHTALCTPSFLRLHSQSRKSSGFRTETVGQIKQSVCNFIKLNAEKFAPPSQSWVDAWNPRAQNRATRNRGQASGGPPAQPGRGPWSSCCCCCDWMGCSSGWCSGWCSGRCPGSHRFLWYSSSLGEKRRAGVTCRGPAGRSSFLCAGKIMRSCLAERQKDLFFTVPMKSFITWG